MKVHDDTSRQREMGKLNFKLLVEYDGTAFHGWQSQQADRTVQDELEAALKKVTGQRRVTVIGAGRTDAGVHALGQVAHVKLDTTLPAERLRLAINSNLAEDLRVQDVERVDDDFHARFSAVRRRYSYTVVTTQPVIGRQYVWSPRRVLQRGLDRAVLARCAQWVLGRHDFAGFAKANIEIDTTMCHVDTSRWEHSGSRLVYHIAADHFLHHMIRYLVGTMLEVARGRYTVDQFSTQVRQGAGEITVYRAPASGLILEEVQYTPPRQLEA